MTTNYYHYAVYLHIKTKPQVENMVIKKTFKKNIHDCLHKNLKLFNYHCEQLGWKCQMGKSGFPLLWC